MINFIIPLIHPEHIGVNDYNYINSCLKKTIESINNISTPNIGVIVVGHIKPDWCKNYKNKIIFIYAKASLFTILKNLDCNITKSNDVQHQSYQNLINMNGKYHNKDKGLKYLIGLCYIANLPNSKKPKYVGLIDGDDFIHKNIYNYLENQNPKINLFNINRGYLLSKDEATNTISLYNLDNFSKLCGTNRIFKYSKLKLILKHRLSFNIKNIKINENNIIDDIFIENLCYLINNKPHAWNIIPLFLGKHVIKYQCGYSHKIYTHFNIKNIEQRLAIKYQHDNNHSNRNKNDNENIIKKYTQKGFISNKHNQDQVQSILKQFGH